MVGVGNSGAGWFGFMNVFNLGGGYEFGSPWGVADLRTSFDDGAQTLTLLPNSIGDPNPYWYTPSGGPGSTGNKIMEANLYREVAGGSLSGTTVTFNGSILSNSFTSAHTVKAFIRDFSSDFSNLNEQSIVLSSPGRSACRSTRSRPEPHRSVGLPGQGRERLDFGHRAVRQHGDRDPDPRRAGRAGPRGSGRWSAPSVSAPEPSR